MDKSFTKGLDPEIKKVIEQELNRQQHHVELIASENYVSPAVLDIAGTILTNKYAEGYPNARYYNGCEFVDKIENLAIERFKKLFDCQHKPGACKKGNFHANVQPHAGSQANAEAYAAILKPGDTILGMELDAGGHLTHGYKINFSGKTYHGVGYGVNKDELLDYDEILKIAKACKPQVIVAGASAYSRKIDWSKFRKIADEVGAYLMVDMAHIAGLIATGLHQNPICYADITTTTTHKTLRGPRGGAILCTEVLKKKVDSAVFPGNQGGPLEHIIAAKAQAFYEALQPEFKVYQQQVIRNAQALAKTFYAAGFHVVADGTDNHLLTINVTTINGLNGAVAVNILEKINIVANKNGVPFDKLPPITTSGVRFGSPAMTTRGFKEKEFIELANIIIKAWKLPKGIEDNGLHDLRKEVDDLLKKFPIYEGMELPK
ncbi:serine hydroxymethyltransferase [Spiroplasma endosymbiont of Nebria brevicollis]|uniref:serine hydroxymethyltransferase n=1 Tax=Spiroplasma endosymbiont of Nebria brevicollis TaxID=3066284 RepID=UPI00313B1F35